MRLVPLVRFGSRRRGAIGGALALALVVLIGITAGDVHRRRATGPIECVSTQVAEAASLPGGPDRMGMVDWFATHPENRPAVRASANAAVTDSFLVQGFTFVHATTGLQDTAFVFEGDGVKWNWVVGSHTITDGTGGLDPNAGLMFDAASSTFARSFTFFFPTAGVYPFFCRIHETFGMKGVVVVKPHPAGVAPGAAGGEGFARPPFPNPARGSSSFRLAMARPGRVALTILDAQGRRVATVLDGDHAAGTFDATWNGLTAAGRTAAPGRYLARLEMPGLMQTRALTLIR